MPKRHAVHETIKLQKIAGEIYLFCHRLKTTHINIDYREFEDRFEVVAKTGYDPSTLDQLKLLYKHLSVDRQEEMEGYYWELTGNYTDDTALSIVGMMTDEADISYDDDFVTIKVVRKK